MELVSIVKYLGRIQINFVVYPKTAKKWWTHSFSIKFVRMKILDSILGQFNALLSIFSEKRQSFV